MKIEVKENAVFQPIVLKIVIETEEELCNLWHRLNLASKVVNQNSDILKHGATGNGFKLWEELNKLIIKYNLNNEAE